MILEDILKILKKGNLDKAYTAYNESYTYLELYKYICNIYKFLLDNDTDKKPIIIYGSKEIYMKASFLACSFAGITYVPIDKSMPKERVNYIIDKVKPYCIIGDFENDTYQNVSKEQINNIMSREKCCDIENIYLKPEDIYYIIFTSGSTGVPKGVKVTYSNLDSCIKWLQEVTKIKKGVVLNQAIFSFDLSVADLYLSLISGSEHFIIDNTSIYDFSKMFEDLKTSNATIAILTPSFADFLLLDRNFNKELMPRLETILFCGEKLLASTVEKLYSRFENIKIINSYGPTECTFAVTSIEITKEILKQQNIPVGTPKDDVSIFIVDKYKKKLAEKEIGEILIMGGSVANGYLEEDEKKSFIKYENEKSYLTGDLGYLENGILYYQTRCDNQIKYKGYRIELADIEKNIYNLDYIEKVKVIAEKSDEDVIKKIIAFVKVNDDKTEKEIKKDLIVLLPNYMIPNIKIIDKFPINKNGKTDIEELRKMINGR